MLRRLRFVTLLTIIGLLAGGGFALATVHAQAAGTPLRQVDWAAALANDTSGYISVPPDCPIPPPTSAAGEPCIEATPTFSVLVPGLAGADLGQPFGGYALLGSISYGDMDGDGLEEAVIPTDSYGTGGSFGFLVYHQAVGAPQLIAAVPGYKVLPQIIAGQLVVTQPFYFGFEANCCPTGVMTTPYLDQNNALSPQPSSFAVLSDSGDQQPASAAELLVAGYYRAIGSHNFDAAYAMLGPALQAAQSFDSFVAGFSLTQSVSATFQDAGDNSVAVAVTSVDGSPDGRITRTRTFAGTWTIGQRPALSAPQYGVTPYDLELDAANIVETTP
jgi:hypothetical protein